MPNRDHEHANSKRPKRHVGRSEPRVAREPSSRALDAARWPRAEGYARQRTDVGHRHESVYGEQEETPDDAERDAD